MAELVLANPALAADRKPPQPSDPPRRLDALIAEALAHNPDLAAAHLEVDVMRAKIGHVGTWPEPALGGGIMLMEMGTGVPQPTMPDLTLSQTIPDPARLDLAVQEARHAADESADDARALDNRIARRVSDAYADAAYAGGALAENLASTALTRELVQVATARYASGQGTMGDVLRAQAELSRLADARDALEQQRTAALADLGALVGQPGSIVLVEPLSPVSPPPIDWLSRIASASPQIAAADDDLAARRSQLSLSRRERVAPSYGAQVGVGLWNPGNRPYLSGMVTVTLPWLAPVRYEHLVHHAMDHAAAAEAQLEAVGDDLRAEAVRQSSALARSQQEVSRYEQGIVPQLDAAYRSSLAAYEVGKTDFADVIAEERDLYEARLTVLQALSGERKAFAALQALAGDFAK